MQVSIAGRLYYPAAQAPEPSGAAWLRPWAWRLPGIPWLEHSTYAQGLAKFLFIREPESLKNSVLKRVRAGWSARLPLLQASAAARPA